MSHVYPERHLRQRVSVHLCQTQKKKAFACVLTAMPLAVDGAPIYIDTYTHMHMHVRTYIDGGSLGVICTFVT